MIFLHHQNAPKALNIKKEESAMGADANAAEEKLVRYRGYLEIVQKLPFGQNEIFDKIVTMVRCVYHEMKQKLAYHIYEQLRYGPLGNWGAAQRAINREFLDLPEDKADEEWPDLNNELLHTIVLKCLLLAAYENLQAENPQMCAPYNISAPEGYLDDERAIRVLQSLDEKELGMLAEKARQIKNIKPDILFYLGGEIHRTFEKHRQALI